MEQCGGYAGEGNNMVDGDGRHEGIVAALTYLRDKQRTREIRHEDVLTVVFSVAIGVGFTVLTAATICGVMP